MTTPKPTGADMRFVWLDLETTGLDEHTDRPLAAGVIVTNGLLEPLAIDEVVIWQPDSVLERMPPVVASMHTGSGLLARVQTSTIDQQEADRRLARVIAAHVKPGEGTLAGNSIHYDRRFVRAGFPGIETFLGYRMLDVSVFKVIAQAWGIELPKAPGPIAHTPIADLSNSLREFQVAIAYLFAGRDVFSDAQCRIDALRVTLEAFGKPNVTATVPKAPPIPASFEIAQNLAVATGKDLDAIGELLGVPRDSYVDAHYRVLLRVKQHEIAREPAAHGPTCRRQCDGGDCGYPCSRCGAEYGGRCEPECDGRRECMCKAPEVLTEWKCAPGCPIGDAERAARDARVAQIVKRANDKYAGKAEHEAAGWSPEK